MYLLKQKIKLKHSLKNLDIHTRSTTTESAYNFTRTKNADLCKVMDPNKNQ